MMCDLYHPWHTWLQAHDCSVSILYRNTASPQNVETKIESGAMFALPVRIKPKAGKGVTSEVTWVGLCQPYNLTLERVWMVIWCHVFVFWTWRHEWCWTVFFQLSLSFHRLSLRTSVWPGTPGGWRLRDNPMHFQCVLLREGAWRCIYCRSWEDSLMLDHVGWRRFRFEKLVWFNIAPLSNWDDGNFAFSPKVLPFAVRCPSPFLLFVVKAAGKHLAFPQRRWWWWRSLVHWWGWSESNNASPFED